MDSYQEIAGRILASVGGAENVLDVIHCATRLRFNLQDSDAVNKEQLQSLEAVKGIVPKKGQIQLVIGQGSVGKVYTELEKMLDAAGVQRQGSKQTYNILNNTLEAISSIFSAIVPAVVGAGLLWGISYSLTALGWVDSSSSTYILLNTFGNSAFYFLPIYIAFSAGKRFGCNPFVAAVVGGILIHPAFTSMIAAGNPSLNFLGIPITLQNYGSTIIPSILTVLLLSFVEKGLKKIIPNSVDLILTPTISLIICGVAGLALLAPLGNIIGTFVAEGLMWFYNRFGIIGGMLYGFAHSLLVTTGMQVAFTPIVVQNLATLGYDYIYPFAACANAAQAVVCFYVFLKTKNSRTKSISGSACISALVGITEPAVFGVSLRFKKMMLAACIGGAAGSVIMALFKVIYRGFGLVPFGTFVLALGPTFVYYLLGVIAAMAVTLVMAHILGFSDQDDAMSGRGK
jgi:PTS system beta-glucosides-specific IIC component